MSRKEQIEAMTEIIDRAYYAATGLHQPHAHSSRIAIELYDAGFQKEIVRAEVRRQTLTKEKVDEVLKLDLGRHKFKNPRKVRAICKMRTTGANYTEIGKKYGLSSNRVREIVRRVEHLYRIYIENGSTS